MKRRAAKNVKSAAPKSSKLGGDLACHPGASTITGKISKDLNKEIAALPFVSSRKRGEKGGRCFWSVKSTRDYRRE
jgi:hypothetical protein